MKNIFVILCFVCITLKNASALSSEVQKNAKVSEGVRTNKAEDLEGAETVGKLFNLKGIFPSYGTNYYPDRYPSSGGGGYYPSTGGNYYPSSSGSYYPSSNGGYYPSYNPSNGYYPSSASYPTSGYYPSGSSGYYPPSSTGTNILGHGSGGGGGSYPSSSFYPSSNPWYRTTSDYGLTGSASFGGYGGYGARI
ncbi:pupal cuticle protein Edg-91 isoform X2 [Episyrphus balteatus]|uniref:pupal cuticle protein Edg-91 isoform X2 n=1 Tax=Episyrphus balteatus TaxID=286459 RepID=UPI002485DFFC|nr:pupal cuticle protein Edg-91 isoform X2 [Episyrphus balteatus]